MLAQILNFNTITALSTCRYKTTIFKHRKQAGLFYITIVVTDIALTANMGAIVVLRSIIDFIQGCFPPQFHTQCNGSSVCLRTIEGSCRWK